MSKLHRDIEELKLLTYEELFTKKSTLLAEKVKIESKLDQAKLAHKAKEIIDEEWFSRTRYAYNSTEALIGAINNEITLRDRRSQLAYEKLFVQAAKQILSPNIFDKIATTAMSDL